MAKVKTEDGFLEISAQWGQVDLKIELSYTGLYFIAYLVLLSLLFFSLSLPPFQAYWFIPPFLLALLLGVAFYGGLDYRYFIVSSLLFLVSSLYFFMVGAELLAQSLASYALGFSGVGLLFIPLGPLVKKIRDRGYLALLRRAYVYLFLLLVLPLPFFMVNSLYQAEIRKVLGSSEPRLEARGLLSSGLIYPLRSHEKEARRALEKSFGVVLVQEIPSRFLKGKEIIYGAAYNDLNETPKWMEPDREYTVPMEIINTGSATWEVEGDNPIHFSYRWSDPERKEIIIRDGLRTPLPRKVGPREKVTLEARVRSPSTRGTFMLSYQLVKEGEFWFEDTGVTSLRRIVTVSPVKESKEFSADFLGDYNIGFINNQAKQLSIEVQVAHEGSYRLLIGERWQGTLKTLRVKVDQGEWQSVASGRLEEGLADLGKIYLDQGTHRVYLKNSVPSYNFDCAGVWGILLLKESERSAVSGAGSSGTDVGEEGGQQAGSSVSWERINRIKYWVRAKSETPFFLYLNSPYNPNWLLTSKGKVIPLHYQDEKGGNLWFIKEAGEYDLVLEYRGVDILAALRWASLIAVPLFIILIPVDLYRLRKSRKVLSSPSIKTSK